MRVKFRIYLHDKTLAIIDNVDTLYPGDRLAWVGEPTNSDVDLIVSVFEGTNIRQNSDGNVWLSPPTKETPA